jgi:hypothetical protein
METDTNKCNGSCTTPTVVRLKNVATSPAEYGNKIDCAGEGQHQFTVPTDIKTALAKSSRKFLHCTAPHCLCCSNLALCLLVSSRQSKVVRGDT